MRPIGKYILVNQVEEEVKASSGLILSSESASDLRYRKGIVAEQGTDVQFIDKGKEIYYDARAGHSMLIEGKNYTIIKEHDVVVVL